jgi:hypothetical protein
MLCPRRRDNHRDLLSPTLSSTRLVEEREKTKSPKKVRWVPSRGVGNSLDPTETFSKKVENRRAFLYFAAA